MKCPACGLDNDKVLETRSTNSGASLRRRRECLSCGYRFTSYEKIEDKPLMVVKRNGSYQVFDINKIERSLRICTEKRNIDNETIEKLVQSIESEVKSQAGTRNEITSVAIGEEILKQLYPIDTVSYVRFASVYRSFNNLDQFIQEIERIAKNAKHSRKAK